MTMLESSPLYSGNASFVEELYETYLTDPTAVSAEWRQLEDASRMLLQV